MEEDLKTKSENSENQSEDIIKTPTELLIDRIDEIDDLLWISEDGQVEIMKRNLNGPQKILLYLIGVRYAFELDLVDSPEVGTMEIAKKTDVPQMTVSGWYLPLDDVIEKRHLEIWERYSEEEEGFFDQYQLKIENVDKALRYVTGEDDVPSPILSSVDK